LLSRLGHLWNNRGEVLSRLGRIQESLASFDRALELDPGFAPALFGKARVLYHGGRHSEAKQFVRRYFEASDGSDGLSEAARALAEQCDAAE
jgi:tetratricopeptide (TPR) repeat protein